MDWLLPLLVFPQRKTNKLLLYNSFQIKLTFVNINFSFTKTYKIPSLGYIFKEALVSLFEGEKNVI